MVIIYHRDISEGTEKIYGMYLKYMIHKFVEFLHDPGSLHSSTTFPIENCQEHVVTGEIS
jgi:hypothetical protein